MLLWLMACFTTIPEEWADRYPERPFHDYDGDGLEDVDDCDDSDPQIRNRATYFRDADGDGYGIESETKELCSNEDTEGYVRKLREGEVQYFDCDDTDPELNYNDVDGDGLTTCTGDCDDVNALIISPQTFYQDSDGDGFVLFSEVEVVCPANRSEGFIQVDEDAPEDCNDEDASISPLAQEICDEVDNNCDGEIDEFDGLRENPWYVDLDGDGFGSFTSETSIIYACSQPLSYVANYMDCDDTDALVHPYFEGIDGGIELCDEAGKDENCNGIINEDSAADATRWYQDSDSDGFGANFVFQDSCVQPSGFIALSGDCNDLDGTIYPDADEYCNSLDDDCDGNIDEGIDEYAPQNALTFYADLDSDGFGDSNSPRVQCTAPLGYVVDFTDCNDTSSISYPSAQEICDGLDNDCDGSTDEADAVDVSAYYLDSDQDGFGDGAVVQYTCPLHQPSGYVSNPFDCDDSDLEQYPGADEYCNGEDDDCNGGVDEDYALNVHTYYLDSDGDGYGSPYNSLQSCSAIAGMVDNDDDCDDSDALARPSATEFCNNKDDDCDGLVDDTPVDAATYYVDGDGDGHGALVNINDGYDRISCPNFDSQTGLPITPAGFSEVNDDCDDTNADISPSADELCTASIDENCDGHMTVGATDFSIYYADSDGDGFGNPTYSLEICTQPQGYIIYSQGDLTDCDDNDADVFPYTIDPSDPNWVDEELCNGKLDRCDTDNIEDLTPPENEMDDDGDGYVECTIESNFLYNPDGSVNGWENPSQTIYGGGDCDDLNSSSFPNALELCNGAFENCLHPEMGSVDAPSDETDDDGDFYVECEGYDPATWEGDSSVIGGEDCNDNSAITKPGGAPLTDPLACLADRDGDGFADRVWDFCDSTQSLSQARYQFIGENLDDDAGYAVSSAGDIDGDGLDDILIGAKKNQDGGEDAGKVYIVLGASMGSSSTIDLSLADYSFIGEDVDDDLGYAVSSAGDVDGDGLDDILLSARDNDDGGSNVGKTYIFLGASLGNSSAISLTDADYSFIGEQSGDRSGYSLAAAGDVDGDGLDDILIGARGNDDGGNNAGKAYLILGSSLGLSSTIDLSNADYSFVGESLGNYAGESVSGAGDVDGDGLDDILIGAYRNLQGGFDSGKTYLILGSSLGLASTIDLSLADYSFIGAELAELSGESVSSAGDVDGDGLDDILIGAYQNSSVSLSAGRAYLVLGSSLGSISTINLLSADYYFDGEQSLDSAGDSVSSAGDVDGDGLDDILIGAPDNDEGATDGGKSYLILGASLGTSSVHPLAQADYVFIGESFSDQFGISVSSAGDIDGDGLDDILVGSHTKDEGRSAIFSACE